MKAAIAYGVRLVPIVAAAALVMPGCGEQDDFATATMGPQGGRLLLPGGVRLDVPPGALTELADITVERSFDPIVVNGFAQAGDTFSMRPEGLEFQLPVVVSFERPPSIDAIAHRYAGTIDIAPADTIYDDLTAGIYALGDVAQGTYSYSGPILRSPLLAQAAASDAFTYDNEVEFEIEMDPDSSFRLRLYFGSADATLTKTGWPVAESITDVSGGSVATADGGELVVATDTDSGVVRFVMGVPAGLPNGTYALTVFSNRESQSAPVLWGSVQFNVDINPN